MQFTKLFSLVAVVTAVQATPHANEKHGVAARLPEPLNVRPHEDLTLNITGVTDSLLVLLSGLGELGAEGTGLVGGLLRGLLVGGSGALNETSTGIAGILGHTTPAIAQALQNILGTIEVCAN